MIKTKNAFALLLSVMALLSACTNAEGNKTSAVDTGAKENKTSAVDTSANENKTSAVDTSANEKNTSAVEEALASYPVKTDETLTYWRSLPVNISTSVDNFGATAIAQEYEKLTGIKIKYIHPAAGQAQQALNLMISSNELPDIIETHWGQYPGGPTKAIDEEVIINLDEYREYAPAYFKYLEEHPEYDRPSKTDEGKYYAFTSILDGNNLLMTSGPAVRADWLRELGLELPRTVDDWTNMLTAFKNDKGADAPMSFNYGNICYFFNMFEASFDPYADGEIVKYGAIQPEFKEALAIIRDWFTNGLLDKNLVSVDGKLIDSQVINNKTGALITSGGGGIGQYMKTGPQNNPDFDLVAVTYPTKSKEGTPWLPLGNNVNGTGAAITTQASNPALAAKALDYFYTEEGHMLANFGTEGVSYEMKDGYPTYTDIIINNPDGLTVSQALGLYMKAGNGGSFVLDSRYMEQYYRLPQQQAALKNWTVGAESSISKRIPNLTTTSEENAEYARIITEVDKYRSQMIVKFINGIEPLDNFDKYVATMKQLGVERAMEIQTEALKRFNNR